MSPCSWKTSKVSVFIGREYWNGVLEWSIVISGVLEYRTGVEYVPVEPFSGCHDRHYGAPKASGSTRKPGARKNAFELR
jgi:hypothetical protein